MTLGNKIAYYRKKLNTTQDVLARQLGVTNQAVSKWESGQCCPDVMLLPKIAEIFGITIDDLFGLESRKKEDPGFDQVTEQLSMDGLPWEDDNVLRVAVYVGRKLVCGGLARPGFEFDVKQDVDGVCNSISGVTVICGNVDGDVDAGGDVTCKTVGGDVDAGGNVSCDAVGGDVDAGASVACGDVGGDVDAGASVACGDVGGDVNAGTDVRCGNIHGDVDAGCCVECASVDGDIDAGGTVTIR